VFILMVDASFAFEPPCVGGMDRSVRHETGDAHDVAARAQPAKRSRAPAGRHRRQARNWISTSSGSRRIKEIDVVG
jgi:hypothetical protein